MTVSLIGFVAGGLITISFLPQVIKSWKTRQTKDISLPMFLFSTTGNFLWLIYGIFLKEPPIFIANGFTFLFSLSIVFLKLRHG